ncbi:PREDICTED: blue copper protein-like [Nicotiana attenuata]|uniref:blue copper protein-like n=1 Tax=Nicotiana attenuata TaxID=49451 RepID=UPI000904F559|nr:PREDICTED: blue copper protein-like [Nicotiana attenuata]
MAIKLLCLFVIVVSMLVAPSFATEHIVGDLAGWELFVDYNAWANGKDFKVGDTLRVFNYNGATHNVAEIDASAFGSCSLTDILYSDDSGKTTFTLEAAKDYYFTSSKLNDCNSNLRLNVNVQ